MNQPDVPFDTTPMTPFEALETAGFAVRQRTGAVYGEALSDYGDLLVEIAVIMTQDDEPVPTSACLMVGDMDDDDGLMCMTYQGKAGFWQAIAAARHLLGG